MATVRKAKYIYKDGVYYEVGGGGNEDEILARLNNMILVQDDEPTSPDNKIWIKETATPVVIPDMDDIADFVSFAEDQTSRTDAEKAQARANINAEKPWVKVWENASPTSSFSAQTVQLDLSEYTDVKISFLTFNDADGGQLQAFGEIDSQLSGGRQDMLFGWSSNNRIGVRPFWPKSTGVEFGTCQYNGSNRNEFGAPYRIYAR